jgi:hypothetical protein
VDLGGFKSLCGLKGGLKQPLGGCTRRQGKARPAFEGVGRPERLNPKNSEALLKYQIFSSKKASAEENIQKEQERQEKIKNY